TFTLAARWWPTTGTVRATDPARRITGVTPFETLRMVKVVPACTLTTVSTATLSTGSESFTDSPWSSNSCTARLAVCPSEWNRSVSGVARIFWTICVGCTHVVSAPDPAAATILPNPRFRALTEPSESTTHRLLSSETYRTREGTNLLPNGSVASTRSAVATPSLTAVVSCVANASELTSTGFATAGTVSVVLCRSTAACTVRLCASAARVPSTQTALTSPRESVFAGAPSTRAFVPTRVQDTAAA